MAFSVSILNFDGIYELQDFYRKTKHKWVNLKDLSGTYCFCETTTLQQLNLRLNPTLPQLIYIGSGNYHYVTYLALRRINQPFTLILFDHHSDLLPTPDSNIISCGSWLYWALTKLPQLKKAIIIGMNDRYMPKLPLKILHKVRWVTHQQIKNDDQWSYRWMNEIHTPFVYISIDKDVLSEQDVLTNWDHGDMRIDQLMQLLETIVSRYRVVGIDVCGEPKLENDLTFKPQLKRMIHKNSKANEAILNSVLHYIDNQEAS